MSKVTQWQYAIVWEFRVRPGCEQDFERIYGPDGDWARLFRLGKGYLGTELARDQSNPGRYITIDFWESRGDYDGFRQLHPDEYRRLDEKCEGMTQKEAAIGNFQRVAG